MKKNQTKIKGKVSLVLLTVCAATTFTTANANKTASTAANAVVGQYSDQYLISQGCDLNVWKKMVADYQSKAAHVAALNTEQLVTNVVKATPKANLLGQCYDQMSSTVNTALDAYDALLAFFTGGGAKSNKLVSYATKVAVNHGCSLVNDYIASTGVTGQINQVGNLPNVALGQQVNIGGVNMGSAGQILGESGYEKGQGSGIGRVTGNDIANSVEGAFK